MTEYVFAYDEPVICPICGSTDFSLFRPMGRLRCNSCKTSFSEGALVEEAVNTITDYVRNHGITERVPARKLFQSEDYSSTTTLAALVTARQILSYPELASGESITRALNMLQVAINRERLRAETEL